MFYKNGAYYFTIGRRPVGNGVVPPPPASFAISGSPNLAVGFTAYDSAGTVIRTVPYTTGTASASGLPNGSKVVADMSSKDYWTFTATPSTALSATGYTAADYNRDGATGRFSGYVTSDVSGYQTLTIAPKYFTAKSTGHQQVSMTASGGNSRKCSWAWPFGWGSWISSTGCIRDNISAVRKYGYDTSTSASYTATASTLEPVYCSGFAMTSDVTVYNAAGWGNNFAVQSNTGSNTAFSTTAQDYTGTTKMTLSLAAANGLSSRTTASFALGLSSYFRASGSRQTGYITLTAWTASGVAR